MVGPFHFYGHFFKCQPVKIQTDHDALSTMLSHCNSGERLARWCPYLLEFYSDVPNHAGIKRQITHAPLRLFTTIKGENLFEYKLPIHIKKHVAIRNTPDTSENFIIHRIGSIDITKATTNICTIHQPLSNLSVHKGTAFFWASTAQVSHANSEFSINSNRLRVKQWIVDGKTWMTFPSPFRQHMLIMSHHLPICGRTGQLHI